MAHSALVSARERLCRRNGASHVTEPKVELVPSSMRVHGWKPEAFGENTSDNQQQTMPEEAKTTGEAVRGMGACLV